MHAESNVRLIEFDYVPSATVMVERLVPVFEGSPDPACNIFRQKLLELGGGQHNGLLDGGNGHRLPQQRQTPTAARARGVAAGRPPQESSVSPKKRPSPRRGKASRPPTRVQLAAREAVRSSSRSVLMSKPAKILHELLADLKTTCRGCLDKSELVDRLLQVAGSGSDGTDQEHGKSEL